MFGSAQTDGCLVHVKGGLVMNIEVRKFGQEAELFMFITQPVLQSTLVCKVTL